MDSRPAASEDVRMRSSLRNHSSPQSRGPSDISGATPADIFPAPNPGVPDPEVCEGLVLTDNIVPEADGAESDEGKVEALAEAPALHVAEDHGRKDQDDQRPQGQEQSQAQDLQNLEGGEAVSPCGRPQDCTVWESLGKSWEWEWVTAQSLFCPADLWAGAWISVSGGDLVKGAALMGQFGGSFG